VENKNTALVWLKVEASDKLNVLEKKFQEAERQEQMLQKSVKQEISRAKEWAKEIAASRTEAGELDQDMLAAQNTEESTKLRAKAVGDQVGREKKRHEEAVAQLMEEIERCRKTEQESHAAEGTLAKTLEEKAQESKLAKERIMAYMRDKGHQPSPPTTTYRDPAPHIDRKHFEKEEHRNKEA
jgi:chromosome segregation ATPase